MTLDTLSRTYSLSIDTYTHTCPESNASPEKQLAYPSSPFDFGFGNRPILDKDFIPKTHIVLTILFSTVKSQSSATYLYKKKQSRIYLLNLSVRFSNSEANSLDSNRITVSLGLPMSKNPKLPYQTIRLSMIMYF